MKIIYSLRFYFFGLLILLAHERSGNVVLGAEPSIFEAPLYHEATNEFQMMKTTLYQYQTRVDRVAGSYRYDCVGFVSYALRQATPQAWAAIIQSTGTPKGRIPNPIQYRAFLAGLIEKPQIGWESIPKASELRPGDIVAWEHKTETAIGHAVIVGSVPEASMNGSWLVEVYNSTSFPHGDDSRPDDLRAQKMESNDRRSGLGHGKIILITNPTTGALIGMRWSPKAKISNVPIAAGRPMF